MGLRGDTNCDEKVTVADAVLLARVLAEDTSAKITEQGKANADMNDSGTAEQDDLTALLRFLAGFTD